MYKRQAQKVEMLTETEAVTEVVTEAAKETQQTETPVSYTHLFPNICTTHTYDMKIETLKKVKAEGMYACSGGIIGMGET